MSQINPEMRSKASSPEARAKAVATTKRRRAEQKALLARAALVTEGMEEVSLEGIPDREPVSRKKYERKVKGVMYSVTENEWLFLQMAKRLLKGE